MYMIVILPFSHSGVTGKLAFTLVVELLASPTLGRKHVHYEQTMRPKRSGTKTDWSQKTLLVREIQLVERSPRISDTYDMYEHTSRLPTPDSKTRM